MKEHQECMELCPGMDNEPLKSGFQLQVGRQTDVGDIAVGVCYRLPDQEAEDEAFFRQLEKPQVRRPWSSL